MPRPSFVVLALSAVVAAVACSLPDEPRLDAAVAPRGDAFRPVAQMLVEKCGSIDCHGTRYRNMRIYGFGSARLDPTHMPDAPDTTTDEVDRNYESVVAVEPELMRQVVAEGGSDPNRLTLVRKATNLEAHKGGRPIVPGDAAARCLSSWLASAVDQAACTDAVPRLKTP